LKFITIFLSKSKCTVEVAKQNGTTSSLLSLPHIHDR
jgi:hypothetical protein